MKIDLQKQLSLIKDNTVLTLWYGKFLLIYIYKENGQYMLEGQPFKEEDLPDNQYLTDYKILGPKKLRKARKLTLRRQLSDARRNPNSNASMIFKEIREWKQRYCYMEGCPEYEGLLVGAVIAEDDYYYLLLNAKRKLIRVTCLAKLIPYDVIPKKYNVIEYLRKTDRLFLKSIIRKQIKDDELIMGTIYLD